MYECVYAHFFYTSHMHVCTHTSSTQVLCMYACTLLASAACCICAHTFLACILTYAAYSFCMHACMHSCMHACMHACIHAHFSYMFHIFLLSSLAGLDIVCVCVCVCVCMCVCAQVSSPRTRTWRCSRRRSTRNMARRLTRCGLLAYALYGIAYIR